MARAASNRYLDGASAPAVRRLRSPRISGPCGPCCPGRSSCAFHGSQRIESRRWPSKGSSSSACPVLRAVTARAAAAPGVRGAGRVATKSGNRSGRARGACLHAVQREDDEGEQEPEKVRRRAAVSPVRGAGYPPARPRGRVRPKRKVVLHPGRRLRAGDRYV